MINLKVLKDEVGVRITFRCEMDDGNFKYYDYVTTNAELAVWENKDELIAMSHHIVMSIMEAIDDQFLHEQLLERKKRTDDSEEG